MSAKSVCALALLPGGEELPLLRCIRANGPAVALASSLDPLCLLRLPGCGRCRGPRGAARRPGPAGLAQITCRLATAMGYPMHYDDPAAVMEEISRTTPIMGGIHYERLEGKGLIWPCPLDIHPAHPAYREFHQRQRPLFQPGDIDSVQAGG